MDHQPPLLFETTQGFVLPAANTSNPQQALALHSFTGSPYDFRRLGPFLSAHGVSVTAIRLPGHGTKWQDLKDTSYADWWQAAAESLQRLAADGPVWLIGNSFGACLGLDLAARFPQLIKGLISVGISLWFNWEVQMRLALPFVSIFGGKAYKRPVHKATKKSVLATGYYTYIPSSAVYQMYAFNRRYAIPALPFIKCPVLLLHAREDNVTPAISSQYVAAQVSGKATLEFIPGIYHQLLDDDVAPVVARKILQFMQKSNNGSN